MRKGFTLIELVVVLAILAAIAGLVIPQVASLGRTTDMAASAKSQSDLASNIQLYFVLQKRFPQGFDSLLTTGAAAIFNSDTTDANTQTTGLPYGGADGTRLQAQLQVSTLSTVTAAPASDYRRSFSRAGFDYLYDHDTTALNPSNSTAGAAKRDVITGDISVAEVIPTGALALKLVPDGLKAGQRLVAVGIGPRNAAIGKTIVNCPIYNGADKYYGRYVAVFMVYATGERATLVGVIDSYGRTPDYTQQQYNESLPDGARQG